MKRILLTLSILCSLAFAAPAQNIRTLFIEAPDSVFLLLPRNARADCVDFADAGMVYPVTNLLNGKSVLKELDDDYLLLQSTASSTVEMKLLPYGESFLICVVKSVFAEAADSRISFFDSNWKRLDTAEFFTAPSISDFFTDKAGRAIDKCDIYLVSLKANAADNTFVAEYTMPSYMNSDDAAEVKPLLRKITYVWDGNRLTCNM